MARASAFLDWILPPARRGKAVDAGSALLRIVAVACVVMLHMKSCFQIGPQGPLSRQALAVLFACCFWAVPAFVVLSGYHTIPCLEKMGVGEFYRKRLARLAAKALFWGAFFTLLYGVIGRHGLSEWLSGWLQCRPFFHLWYLFMLVGLYALAPVCALALRSRHVVAGALAVQFLVMANPSLFDSPPWQRPAVISLPYVVPFLLGGLLARRQVGRRLGAAAIAAMAAYFAVVVLAWRDGGSVFSYPVCHYLGFFGLAGGLSAVVAMLYIGRALSPAAGVLLFRASRLVLGVYIVHPVVMTALSKALPPAFFSGVGGVACGWAAVCAASFALVALMLKVPVLGRFL